MKGLIYTITALITACFMACTKTIYVPVEHRHKEVVRLRDTIIEMATAGESHTNHTLDTTSLLQAKGAWSQATIANGILSHTLIVEPRRDSITIQLRDTHTIDTISYALPPVEKVAKTTPICIYILIYSILASITTTIVIKTTHLGKK